MSNAYEDLRSEYNARERKLLLSCLGERRLGRDRSWYTKGEINAYAKEQRGRAYPISSEVFALAVEAGELERNTGGRSWRYRRADAAYENLVGLFTSQPGAR